MTFYKRSEKFLTKNAPCTHTQTDTDIRTKSDAHDMIHAHSGAFVASVCGSVCENVVFVRRFRCCACAVCHVNFCICMCIFVVCVSVNGVCILCMSELCDVQTHTIRGHTPRADTHVCLRVVRVCV